VVHLFTLVQSFTKDDKYWETQLEFLTGGRSDLSRKKTLSVSLSALVLVLFLTEMVYSQSNSKNLPFASVTLTKSVQPIAFFTSVIDYTSFYQNQSNILSQSTRLEIYTFIEDNPGTHFRDICEKLELSVGVVQYHLKLLTKAELISVYDDNRYKRFFQSGRLKESEMRLISLLRHKTVGRILLVLSKNQSISHQSLTFKIGISSQALSWQMRRLRRMEVVDTVRERLTVKYFVTGKNVFLLSRCLSLVNLR